MPNMLTSRPVISGGLVAILGAVFAVGGGWLLALGGSPYYLVAGLGMLASGALIAMGQRWGVWLYAAVWLGTMIWAIAESGLNFWLLEPKVVAPTILGVYLFMPWITRKLAGAAPRPTLVAPAVFVLATLVLGVVAWVQPVGVNGVATGNREMGQVDKTVPDADWQFYGRTPKGDRFSPLGQITLGNVKTLKLAWSMQTGDTMRKGEDIGGTDAGHEFNFENTPVKVDKNLYVCTGHSWIEAVDAATGKLLWKFNPNADTAADVYLACRGVAFYQAPADAKTDCPRRIISPVLDARLVAVNADTGKLCEDFGVHGYVSLLNTLGHVPAGFHYVTSPPLVLHDRVILGGWIYDNQAENEPSGAIRSFDPMTGKLIWAWDLGRPEGHQVVHDTDKEPLTRGTPNAWGVYTADPALNLVYLPLGNATPDYFGGHRRPADDEYNSSIVALDITTGEPRWHFQTTHHDLWDMDLPVGPSLVDVPDGKGGHTPALVQSGKRGEFFMLDRRTGTPVATVTEKPVPTDTVRGDHASPTQPYSTGLPSVAPKNLTEAALWGATPIDQMMCRIEFKKAHYEGQFTPPSLKETIVYPAFDGVVDWNGAAIDPERKLLITLANYIPFMVKETPRNGVKPGDVPAWNGSGNEPTIKGGYAPQYGTPYVGSVHPWLNPIGVPCNAPPWGTVSAIDLATHKLVWQHPIGTTRDTGLFGLHANLPLPTGIFNIGGGGVITEGGLYFVGGTADNYLRAIDENTGKVVWKARLPAGGQANPMSYAINGKQYVVIAAGGHGGLGTKTGDYVLAYAIP
ncbi:MAG: membrane-bound PQQ-dependent dehydrogenase, glucose/quinate/shikimate family [Caulobacteraceae bacterium]